MTFPCKMENIVSAKFRTYSRWRDLPSSPYYNVACITSFINVSIFDFLRKNGEFPTITYNYGDFQLLPFSSEYATYLNRADLSFGTKSENHFIIEKLDDFSLKITWNYIKVFIRRYNDNYSSTTADKIFGPREIAYTPWFSNETCFYFNYLE